MYTETTLEWWKLRIYQETTEFLNNPSNEKRSKLNTSLASYQQFLRQHKPHVVTSYDDYEHLISA